MEPALEDLVDLSEIGASRWLAAAKLTGQWRYAALNFRPNAKTAYFREQQEAYTNAIAIDSQTAIALREKGFDAKYMAGGHSSWKANRGATKLLET